MLALLGGADGITIHLREDRRHIQERDLQVLRKTVATRLNLEMAVAQEMLRIAYEVKPDMVTLVPERKFKPGSAAFLARNAATMYASKSGPDYENQANGTIFKQFNRTTDYEVWLYFRPEWGWHNPSKILYFDNLSVQNTAG